MRNLICIIIFTIYLSSRNVSSQRLPSQLLALLNPNSLLNQKFARPNNIVSTEIFRPAGITTFHGDSIGKFNNKTKEFTIPTIVFNEGSFGNFGLQNKNNDLPKVENFVKSNPNIEFSKATRFGDFEIPQEPINELSLPKENNFNVFENTNNINNISFKQTNFEVPDIGNEFSLPKEGLNSFENPTTENNEFSVPKQTNSEVSDISNEFTLPKEGLSNIENPNTISNEFLVTKEVGEFEIPQSSNADDEFSKVPKMFLIDNLLPPKFDNEADKEITEHFDYVPPEYLEERDPPFNVILLTIPKDQVHNEPRHEDSLYKDEDKLKFKPTRLEKFGPQLLYLKDKKEIEEEEKMD